MADRKEVVRGLQDAIGLARERGSAVVHLRTEHAEALLEILNLTDPYEEQVRRGLNTWVKECDELLKKVRGK